MSHERHDDRGSLAARRCIYAPLAAGLLQPVHGDARLQDAKRHQRDRLYQRVVDDLDRLRAAVGLEVAA